MPNSNYEIYVDEDLLKKGAIDPRTIAIERFYEALDELDQYDLGLENDDNFFIQQLKDQNEKIKKERASMRQSFLEKQTWKVVNPSKKLFDNSNKIEFSKKTQNKHKKIENDLSLFDDLSEDNLELESMLGEIVLPKKQPTKRKASYASKI